MNPNHLPAQQNATPDAAPAKSSQERRRSMRAPTSREFIRAAWESNGGALHVGLAALLDVSESGAALEMPDAPREGTWVRFECEEASIFGMGRVCYVTGAFGRFVVGVEFSDNTFWRAAAKKSYLTLPKGLRERARVPEESVSG